ncbi:uncharacterized protein PV09_04758 [Verruconis gallopava]|uniref:Heterokaryon incompatibility domain-containing protein n=1 Tax=Verruconis gallopava TaxID=253628 RepID=A0A0D2ABI7_9PEZI|nr:uncharacterized protein PV09_04758 [Verruconis gallopava]KIW03915.1 hypothetical protein PV09_04758 [Verruconis gallopava]
MFSFSEGRFAITSTSFCNSDEYPEHICHSAHSLLEIYPSIKHRFSGFGEYFMESDPNWPDIARIQRWLKHCETEHGKECISTSNNVYPGPARMIDVVQQCIVENTGWPSYAAMSYVWGKTAPGLAAIRSNIWELSQPGALFSGSNGSFLASTVQDFMLLTKRLGFKHAWVDRVCIIQDDDNDKINEIRLMGEIYKNASLTIVCMDGEHADHGIPGISSPRRHRQFILDLTSEVQVLGAPIREQPFNKMTWHARAWTYQERLLSSRKLCFFENTYFWECGLTHWTEDIAAEADDQTVDNFYFRSLADATSGVIEDNPFPDLQQYCDLVEEYCTRQIGLDTDALNACSAILARLRPSWPGGFHFGLPEFFFDITMLWILIKPLERRPEFPSWSWLGWKNGAISHQPYASFYFPTSRYSTRVANDDLLIYPCVTWYRTSRCFPNDDFEVLRIDNSYHVWRAKAEIDSDEIAGWDKMWDNSWTKTSLVEKGYEFRYPVPIGSATDSTHELSCQEHCKQYLSLSTYRAIVRTGGVIGKAFKHHSTCMVDLLDFASKRIGILSSDSTKASKSTQAPLQCEVIIISEGVAKGKSLDSIFLEVKKIAELEGTKAYMFYNVLAIERDATGIASRKGVGRVWKTAWERLNAEIVDIWLN